MTASVSNVLPELQNNPSAIVVRVVTPLKVYLSKYKSASEFYRAFSISLNSIGGMSNRAFVKRVLKGGYYLTLTSENQCQLIFILILKDNKKTPLILTSIKMRFNKLLEASNITITDFDEGINDDLRDVLSLKGAMGMIQPIRESYSKNKHIYK